ncbi:carbohydrate-binding domain-containing protein [uncultured Anaerococcus sp.]|uniref:carbohydrate-binding domain-containing protein n=1 Tax=uncultured Anaerococcus sp. TaxID=293428 RepID=UPI0026256DED|nr:carbohydrate-binding domain-containing protein [uncultured Anaerococcus sp.]
MKNKLVMILAINAFLLSACDSSSADNNLNTDYIITSSENLEQEDSDKTKEESDSQEESDSSDEVTKINLDEENPEITSSGNYELTGSLEDGSLIIDVDKDSDNGEVNLVLNNVRINSNDATPIYIKEAEKVNIILADGSTNAISQATIETTDEDFPSAAIFSKADLEIKGEGSLDVKTEYNDAITSKDTLSISSGNITLDAAQDGLVGKDELIIDGGEITIESGKKALRSTNEEKGYLTINDGKIRINSSDEGLEAYHIAVNGGDVDISSSDDGINAKTDGDIEINDGTILIKASGDGIDSNGTITINGGKTTIDTTTLDPIDTALDADGEIVQNGGEILDETGEAIDFTSMMNGQNGMGAGPSGQGGPQGMQGADPNGNQAHPQMPYSNENNSQTESQEQNSSNNN